MKTNFCKVIEKSYFALTGISEFLSSDARTGPGEGGFEFGFDPSDPDLLVEPVAESISCRKELNKFRK